MRTSRILAASIAVIMGLFTVVAATRDQPLLITAKGDDAVRFDMRNCMNTDNPIVCENAKEGTPRSRWDVPGAGSPTIQGFAASMSVTAGERIDFKVRTDARAYDIEIYRTGYYAGSGARLVATVTPSVSLPQAQPACLRDEANGLVDCGSWETSASWLVPATAVSGVYVAKLVRPDTGAASHILFVVRNDARAADIVVQTSDPTWQAYNPFGGSNLYDSDNPLGRATKVSYNRPLTVRGAEGARDSYFSAEYPIVQFLEANGYDVTYVSGFDVATRPGVLDGHRAFVSMGHDEYWSGAQRAAVEAARDSGTNLAFFSGNEVYWRTRLEPSLAPDGGENRTIVCYKESRADQKIDPSPEWTGTWRDNRFDQSMVAENALTGTAYRSNTGNFAVTVTPAFSRLRAWRSTPAAGTTVSLAPGSLGYEFDEAPDDSARPGGLVRLSLTRLRVEEYLVDYGATVLPARATHSMTMYRHRSGALVFGAGTIQWGWGLGMWHVGMQSPANRSMQQFTINVLADMGVRSQTPLADLEATDPSDDRTPPRVAISEPQRGAVMAGPTVTVRGLATDVGGRVASVEVSVDGGRTWSTARGRERWTASVMPRGAGLQRLLVRAVDDSYNIGRARATSFDARCPCTVFGDSRPPVLTHTDRSGIRGVELGLRFASSATGSVVGMRFFQGPGNTGPHVVRLWGPAGELLARATAPSSRPMGWRTVRFPAPVPIAADKPYVVSYHSPRSSYSLVPALYRNGPVTRPPLTAFAGVFAYGAGGSMPTATYRGADYAVDAIVTDGGP